MTKFIKPEIQIKSKVDERSKKRYLNGISSVLHCHHFITLYTQLAMDAEETSLLEEVAQDNFHEVLNKYFIENNISDFQEKAEISCQYYSVLGLGTLEIKYISESSAEITSKNSHIDAGWIKKWGNNDKAVNFIGRGYVSAMLSIILAKPIGSFKTSEIKSIVKGDNETVFKSIKK